MSPLISSPCLRMPAGPSPPSPLVTALLNGPSGQPSGLGISGARGAQASSGAPDPLASFLLPGVASHKGEVSLEDTWMNGDLEQEAWTLAGAEGASLVGLVATGFNSAD